ncbi:hypothetical protein KG007_13410 [Alistipes sp. kh20]|uniref:hypothetical protein n=1 Tax=Alistipes montrealensis TaxID=2834113 RepID=UPI001BCF0711|nr:hypothetical protein [Alistipes montrealensis]MBS4767196.1 hypothetical protein [Alistipes montrealensis]
MLFFREVYDAIDPRKIAWNAALICLLGADFTNEEEGGDPKPKAFLSDCCLSGSVGEHFP